MKSFVSFFVFQFSFTSWLFSQADSLAIPYAQTISSSNLNDYLKIIASEEFEGRETGKEGQKKAADYISHFFLSNNISYKKEYIQKFSTVVQNPYNVRFITNSKEYQIFKDFYFFPEFNDTSIQVDSLLFLGYGIDDSLYSDYQNNSIVKDKVAIILSGEPVNKKGISYLSNTEYRSEWTYNWKQKLTKAKAMGLKALLIADDEFTIKKDMVKHITKTKMVLDIVDENNIDLPVFFVSYHLANDMLKKNTAYKSINRLKKKINKTGKPITFITSCSLTLDIKIRGERIETENVIGFIEGNELKNEVIVISAHYDHLGKKDSTIYYGADDDGSGTAALLELAQAFSIAKANGHGPKRSVMFIAFTAEEKGLLGSKFYTRFPVFHLDSTVANLNIDMIGRQDTAHKNNPNYIYIIGSDKLSTELHTINEKNNKNYTQLDLDYRYNDPHDHNRFYYRSDHYNFAKNNIPVIFYFNGVHEDYHKPTDTIDKINFDKMEKITQLVFYTAWDLANRDERIKLNEEVKKESLK